MTLQVARASKADSSHRSAVFQVTLRCHNHTPWLRAETHAARLARLIDRSSAGHDVELLAFVFLPDHAHLIVVAPTEERTAAWSRLLLNRFASEVRAGGGAGRLVGALAVWEPAPPRIECLLGPAAVAAAIGSAHKNPVRRGLCDGAHEWRWSSWRHYHERPESLDPEFPRVRVIEDLPECELLMPA